MKFRQFEQMNEEILYAVWIHKWFQTMEICTVEGQTLQILRQGIRNENSGPDFSDARIRIADQLWAGNVEIHVKSSDWELHRHHEDPAYNNVILHVVYQHDKEVMTQGGGRIPTLELQHLMDKEKVQECLQLLEESSWLKCAGRIHEVSPVRWSLWLDRMAIQRLEAKTVLVKNHWERSRFDWEECLYKSVASAFGFRVNSPAFEMLSESLPYSVLRKYAGNLFIQECLLFGMSGLLDGFFQDQYPRKMQNEFSFFMSKHSLSPLPGTIWKFMRLRPRNFPTLRISQFAQIIASIPSLLDQVLGEPDPEKLTGIFNVAASAYWSEHYQFDKPAGRIVPNVGWESAQLIVINGIVPFLFFYGKQQGEERYVERAMRVLEGISAENNAAMREWKQFGISPSTAMHSQALLQLKNRYCTKALCLRCSAGISLLNRRNVVLTDKGKSEG